MDLGTPLALSLDGTDLLLDPPAHHIAVAVRVAGDRE
jgi:hypothetical protein